MSDKKVIRKKKKLGSYPSITVVFSITLALIVLGFFGLLITSAQKISKGLKNNFEVHIYLNDNLSDNQIKQLEGLLASKKFVAKDSDGNQQIEFISKSEAAKKYISKNNEDFIEVLGYNPLKNAFKITINDEYSSEENIASLKQNIENLNGVFEVDMVENLIHEINRNVAKISLILLIVAVFLIIIIFILINNTIKLALFSQRFLIRSMQLVGATSTFIQGPYVKRAIIHGLISGILAGGFLFAFQQYLYENFEELRLLEDIITFAIITACLVIFGIIIGLTSSALAVRKYIKMSLDDLY